MRRLWALVLASVGCAGTDNAVLEVRLLLPTRVGTGPEERPYANVAVVASDVPLDFERRLDLSSRVFALDQRDDDGCNVTLSIVADRPREDRARLERGELHGLAMVVWFCPTRSACDSRKAPKWLFDFDKALWPGERTFFAAAPPGGACSTWDLADLTLPMLQSEQGPSSEPDFAFRVRKCEVLGCLDEASQPAQDVGFCAADGSHPCE